jgi:DNA-binding MarR family transcriptional regulator
MQEGEGGTVTDGIRALDEDVHWLMARLARSLGVMEHEVVAPFGITLRDYVVMVEVATQPGRSQLAVARSTVVDKSLMVTAVDRLENRGLLVRAPDPNDRRVRALSLTDAGHELLKKVSGAVHVAESQLLSVLPKTERRNFVDTLRRLADQATDVGFDVTPSI